MVHVRDLYSIRQVVQLTGVTEFSLRAWELRYSALTPRRTPTGRRIYSSTDILKVKALFELTKRNYRVGKIARLSLSELQKRLIHNLSEEKDAAKSRKSLMVLEHACLFKWDIVRQIIFGQISKQSTPQVIHSFLLPLIAEMNQFIQAGRFSIAQEHILTAIIKEGLVMRPSKKRSNKSATRWVFATPEGDFHDLGLLMASRLARYYGLNILFLGPNVPKEDLSETCLRFNATHLVLTSSTTEAGGSKESLYRYVNFLDRNLGASVEFWLGGHNPMCHGLSLKRPHEVFNSFEEYERGLKNV